ncbi:MAG: hypothetical protein ABIT71_08285 [Vicinamibacteraceae bacterium]
MIGLVEQRQVGEVGLGEVVDRRVGQWRTERRQSTKGSGSVLGGRPNPDVQIARGAWHAVGRQRVRSDDQELNAGRGQCGQYVGEVWVHRPSVP